MPFSYHFSFDSRIEDVEAALLSLVPVGGGGRVAEQVKACVCPGEIRTPGHGRPLGSESGSFLGSDERR